MAVGRFLAPLNGRIITQPVEKPYVDDIFDPLFNREVRNYYNGLYGPIVGIGAGYADMLENALTGQKGILGPGMGILSTFGRSMDKADDFILGGLTEGVNALGQITGGTNEAPQNPFARIFVDDYDYQGAKLMAAAGNAMARLAGTQTPLDESDFQALGDKVAGTAIDLATDPGIMGGQLAKLNPNTPVGQIGQILSDYDDAVANVAGNMAFPGAKAMLSKGRLSLIKNFLGGASSTSPEDYVTKKSRTSILDASSGTITYSDLNSETLDTLKKMSNTYTTNINPIDDPDLYAIKEEINNLTNVVNLDEYNKAMADYTAKQAKLEDARNKLVERIKDTASKQRDEILKSNMLGMEILSSDFQKGLGKGVDKNPEVIIYDKNLNEVSKPLNDLTKKELKRYVKNNFATYDETDYYGNPLKYGKFYNNFEYTLETYGLDEARNMVLSKINPDTKNFTKSNFTFAPNKMGFQSGIAKDSLKLIDHHIINFLHKHPDGLNTTYLRKELGEDAWIPNNVFETLIKHSKGKLTEYNKFSKEYKITGTKFQELLDALYKRDLDLDEGLGENIKEIADTSHSLIPWVKANYNTLQKTQVGRDLIELADNLEKDIFDNNLYETAIKSLSPESIASFNEDIDIDDIDQYSKHFENYSDVISPAKILNQYLSKENFSPEDLATYATYFPYMDLKVSNEYIKKSKEYADWIAKRQPILDKIDKEQFLREKILSMRRIIKSPPETPFDFYLDRRYYNDLLQEYKKINPKNMKPDKWLEQQKALLNKIKRVPTDLEIMLEKYYTPAKKQYWQDIRGTSYAYDFTNITPKNLYDAAKKVLVAPNKKDYIKVSKGLATFTPEDFTKTVTNNFSYQDNVAMYSYQKIFDNFKNDWNLPGDMPPMDLEYYIKSFGNRTEKTLFQQWDAAVESKTKNKLKLSHGAFNVEIVKKSKEHIDKLIKSGKYTPEQIAEYISRKDLAEGVKISGDNFLESLWASKGFKEMPIPSTMSKKQADEIAAHLKKNVEIVNKNGNILKFIDAKDKDGIRHLAVAFDTDNLNIKKDINKIYSLFGKKDLGLSDVVMRNPHITKTKWDSSELDSVFDEIRQGSEYLSTKLGYTSFNPNYISHAMEDTEEAAKTFNDIYKSLGIDKDKLEKLTTALQEQDIASGRLQFGALPMERSHLGYFGQYKNGFSKDLSKIHSSTFTQGMLDNTNAQTFFDLFLSDNFKIKNNFDDWQTLKNALNASEGNLNNLSIVKPKYNDAGKLIGFTRYDKFSDISLQKAYADADAILVPDSVIGPLDRICKKDARMSSKVYRFINKYLTVPFKFGTLANPGFLAGNIQDAYFKQATELAKKYGTDLSEELTNVAFSMRQVIQLNNNFSNIFDGYKQWLKDTDLKNLSRSDRPVGWYNNTFKKTKGIVDTLTIDQIINNPDLYSAFEEYVNLHVPVAQRKMAKLYLFINNNQTTTMFKNNNRDLEDLSDRVTDNPYAVPNNIFERIMYGDPSKTKVVKINGTFREVQDRGFNSYGLFLNNPVSNGILKSSNTIENLMRSSTILNDLQHKGYTIEDMCDILETDKITEKALRDKFKMSMNEAINTMNAANFDYDNVSEFMNKASYILPFPTFYLKNLAFWADIFVNKPQLIDNVISVHEGLWAGKDTSDEFTAEAKGRGAIPIGQQKGVKHLTGIVKQTPYNSMFSAFNAVNNFKEDFAYRTNPILRPIARHLQDPKDIKYRPYNTNQYQKNITQADPKFSELAYMFHQLNPYERFINTGLRTPGKVSRNEYQLSDFLPSMFQPDFSKK